jgi:hypothetical protein
MRQIEKNGRKMVYPDDITFAFNPNIIEISRTIPLDENAKFSKAIFIIQRNVVPFEDTRIAYNNFVRVDISYYLQLLFEIKVGVINETMTGIAIEVNLYNEEDSFVDAFEFTLDCIVFGSIGIGENFNGNQKLKWFKNFPFTVSFYTEPFTSFVTRYDGGNYKVQPPFEFGRITHLYPVDFVPLAQRTAVLNFGSGVLDTFNHTFNYTFRAENYGTPVLIELDIDECTQGVYLRWMDRHGFYKYYLFGVASENVKHTTNGNIIDVEYTDGDNYFNGVSMQNKTEQRELNLFVSLTDKNTVKVLSSILASPFVDMYVNDNIFVPVQIAPGTKSISNQNLQDFEITLILPESQLQAL